MLTKGDANVRPEIPAAAQGIVDHALDTFGSVVHLAKDELPTDYVLIEIAVPDGRNRF
jgi:hypothetical protein